MLRVLPVGADALATGGVHFRCWAPGRSGVAVLVDGHPALPMERDGEKYWVALASDAKPGDRYKLQLDGAEAYPDPASRRQPDGPHGSSAIVDPAGYRWSREESAWPGRSIEGQVMYELHIGTFTREGTYAAAEREFPRLADLGITTLEVMPLAQFSGRWGWGYDGVNLFAPHNAYGTPNELRHFIDSAHRAGLGVVLDVVYNHLGPDGNYLAQFSKGYFAKVATEWGDSMSFDGEDSLPVREFYLANAAYWIREFHFDGLRLDATQSITDNLNFGKHILQEIGEAARAAAGGRPILLIAENEPQDTKLMYPVEQAGYGLDAMWNDDLHHSMMVRLTLKREAYYSDHLGLAQEFVSAARHGFLFQGQFYGWQGDTRGRSTRDIAPAKFITFLENHDQVANTDTGSHVRLRSHPGVYRAMTAFWLLMPGTPMFFQGQEYGAESKFLYFCDHAEKLADAVREGREVFLGQFPSLASRDALDAIPDPCAEEAFQRSKLDPNEADRRPQILALHRELLNLRRTDPVLARQRAGELDGAVLSSDCFVLRFVAEDGGDRLLVVNFGLDLELRHAPEPLLAAPLGCSWAMAWSSDDHRFGGGGAVPPVSAMGWNIPGASASLLVPGPLPKESAPIQPD